MATIRIFGATVTADPVEQTPAGDWLMRVKQHTSRTAPGTVVLVKKSEIVEMAAAEMPVTSSDLAPADPGGSLAELEAGMATERKTLPTFTEIHAANQDKAAVSVSPHPTQRPSRRPTPEHRP
jgi:hypothetical protein